jgi:hypothetical protein
LVACSDVMVQLFTDILGWQMPAKRSGAFRVPIRLILRQGRLYYFATTGQPWRADQGCRNLHGRAFRDTNSCPRPGLAFRNRLGNSWHVRQHVKSIAARYAERPERAGTRRRLRSSMGSPPEPAWPAYRGLRMPRKRPQVLGVDLNCSESRRRAACAS